MPKSFSEHLCPVAHFVFVASWFRTATHREIISFIARKPQPWAIIRMAAIVRIPPTMNAT